MKKYIYKSLSVLFALIIVLTVSAAAMEPPGDVQYAYIQEMAKYINKNYKFEITVEELLGAALKEKLTNSSAGFGDMVAAMMNILDENSSYLPEEEYNRLLEERVLGEFTGIGVSITSRSGRVIVVSPIAGSPAHAAGIQPNDIIVGVDGEDVSNTSMEYVRSLIVGAPGTSVRVSVLRGDKVIDFDIVRAKIQDVPVTYKVKDDVGYIQITAFNNNTAKGVREALSKFDSLGIDRIVLDLRYNSGGELNSAVELCGLFVKKGAVATIEYKDPQKNEVFYSELKNPRYKLAVIINEGSASASELFAGAIQDTKAGMVFGTTSYGKGTVQQILPLVTGGCLRLTIAEYLTAGGRSINKVGIKPDVYVENTKRIPDTSHFADIDFTNVYSRGSESEGVLAIEQRLVLLGYMDEADSVYDEETEEAVKTYQAYRGLPATGVADLYTLLDINNLEYDVPFPVDNQLDMAIDYLRNLK